MSLFACPHCGRLHAPNPGPCHACGSATQHYNGPPLTDGPFLIPLVEFQQYPQVQFQVLPLSLSLLGDSPPRRYGTPATQHRVRV